MPDERRGRLDRAIDRAVREMVQVDPLPGLRRRVDEQLHARAGSGARRPPFMWPALAAAATIASTSSRLSRDSAISAPVELRASAIGFGEKTAKYSCVSSWNVMVSDQTMLAARSSLNISFLTHPIAS